MKSCRIRRLFTVHIAAYLQDVFSSVVLKYNFDRTTSIVKWAVLSLKHKVFISCDKTTALFLVNRGYRMGMETILGAYSWSLVAFRVLWLKMIPPFFCSYKDYFMIMFFSEKRCPIFCVKMVLMIIKNFICDSCYRKRWERSRSYFLWFKKIWLLLDFSMPCLDY